MQNVRFIRKNGRIIPIFQKKAHNDAIKQSLAVGTVASLVAGGAVASHFNIVKKFKASNFTSRLNKVFMPTHLKLVGAENVKLQRAKFAFSSLKDFAKLNNKTLKLTVGASALAGLYGSLIGAAASYDDSFEQEKLRRISKIK